MEPTRYTGRLSEMGIVEQAHIAWKYQGFQEEISSVTVKTDLRSSRFYTPFPTVKMTNSYLYSIKVNEALERYGAKTHGSLNRRVERLKRFTDLKNKQYADEIRLEDARMIANQEREVRLKNRLSVPSPRRKSSGWHAMGSPNYLKDTDTIKMKKDAYLAEAQDEFVQNKYGNWTRKPVQRNLNEEFQEVEIPTTSHSYNLRSREETGLNLLWRAIQNGFVNTNRG